MASPGNPNQPAAFDMHKLFKPANPSLPNPNNLNSSSPFPPSSYPPPPSASYPPPSGTYSYPPQTSPFHPQHHYHIPYSPEQLSNLHHQRSVSFPTPLLQPSPHHLAPPSPNPGARLMALLSPATTNLDLAPQPPMSLPPIQPPASVVSEFATTPNVPILPSAPPPGIPNPAVVPASPVRMPSSKLPKGRPLVGENVVYDVDVRLQGEMQPQLEVTPITKYVSDPGLVLGRQIAVNKTYICYGLKLGAIRVLNINTALRYLLRGHAQRVTDMAFFAEDVHLLASASINGRVYVWKISEGPDEEDKPQITGKIVIAVQIVGEGESVNPRVCWHCHKQEVLVVGIGKRILKIDTTKVGKGESYSADEPLNCPVDKLIDGVQFVGKHDGEVTDLSMCQWMTTRLVSASTDGTIKIWEDRKALPLLVLRPHDGHPVNSATFLTAPHRPDHIILITAGPLNREVKLWASESEEGWLLPSDAESWHCTQTLDLKSSAEPCVEEAFFNQVLALSKSGLLLLANAKKNAIYAVHLEYGPNPAATCMDYIAEFTVTMPILSFTGTSEVLHGEHIVQVYCFQTQAIQQYALYLSQCLPLLPENLGAEKSDSGVSHEVTNAEGFGGLGSSGSKLTEMPVSSSAPKTTMQISSSESEPGVRYPVSSAAFVESAALGLEAKPSALTLVNNDNDIVPIPSPPLPLSPRLSGKLSGFRNPTNNFEPGPSLGDRGSSDQVVIDYSVDRQMETICTTLSDLPSLDDDSRNDENKVAQDECSTILNPTVMFKHPTHLITPSEIFMAVSSAETTHITESKSEGATNVQDVSVNSDVSNVEVEVKVVGETGLIQNDEFGLQGESQNLPLETKEKSFCSQASDIGIEMAKECSALSSESYVVEESRQVDGAIMEALTQPSNVGEVEVLDAIKDVSGKVTDSAISTTVPQSPAPTTKGKKNKGKNSHVSPSPTACISTDFSNEPGANLSSPSVEAAVPQILAMQETLHQLLSMQKEMQKQLSVLVAGPVTKEGRRLEASLGRNMEKSVKANADALWANIQEENAKHEKLVRDRTQQITSLITNSLNKDLPAILEKTVKKEIAAAVPAVARTISPVVEKTISSVITETFQRGVGDKALNQVEKSINSKLEATVARQIQSQFQTSGKQALQDALKSNLEASVIPAFEMSCKAMFDQVDSTFQKGMVEHATTVQQQFESTHSPLALALRDAINSASSITQTLSGELADGQRKLLALAAVGANPTSVNPLVTQLSNGPLGGLHDKVEVPLDPTKELSRLISERKYEEAFTGALQRSDVSIVSWLCSQVDLQGILSMVPQPLSQGVLLSLLQQLACDINKETTRKLGWMTDVAVSINPGDPMIAVHVRPIFDQVYQILNHQRALPSATPSQLQSIRLLMHVINSMLMTCK